MSKAETLPEPSLDFGGRGPWPVCVDGYQQSQSWLIAASTQYRYIYLEEQRDLLLDARKLVRNVTDPWIPGPWDFDMFASQYGFPVMPRQHLQTGRWGVQISNLTSAVKTFAELDRDWVKGGDRDSLAHKASVFLHGQQAGQILYEISRSGQLLPRLRLGPPLAAAVLRLGGEIPESLDLKHCDCGCGLFVPARANQRYRSPACRNRAMRRRKRFTELGPPEPGVRRLGVH